MTGLLRRMIATAGLFALLPMAASAQSPARVTGQVTGPSGPLAGASVYIQSMNIGTLTNEQGRYMLTVPASRFTAGDEVQLTAELIGFKTNTAMVTLTGETVVQNFALDTDVLELDAIVATGAGTQTTKAKLGTTINTVDAEEITEAQESNVVAALAAKAPGVEITSSAGDPGAGAYIRVRGVNSLLGDGQPLFVIDGVPMDNSSNTIESQAAGTTESNRAMDINPGDIESIDILKGPAAAAIYGSRAANGVVLITTKSGRPGTNHMSYNVSYGVDEVTQMMPLQRSYGQGMDPTGVVAAGDGALVDLYPPDADGDWCYAFYGLPKDACPVSWGTELAAGTPTFDHSREMYQQGNRMEHNLTWSGGSDRTTYYLSFGRLDHRGVVKGPNQEYERTTVRLKGSHGFTDNLRIGGNFAYTNSHGGFIQQGSNISGILLGALRAPPEFDNEAAMEGGLHRSYRNKNPSSVTEARGYDNPFWVAFEMPNTSDVGRTVGNVTVDYTPFSWFSLNYTLGADYAADERLSVFPKSSSTYPLGKIIRADFINYSIDHNLVATLSKSFGNNLSTTLSLGQNLNYETYSRYQVEGFNLIEGTDQLDYAIDKSPNEYRQEIRTDGYFGQASIDLFDQLYLTGALRFDGSSTFGEAGHRFAYPKFSGAWEFSQLWGGSGFLSFGKIRGAFGVAGKQPPIYSNVGGYFTGTFTDGWLTPNGLESIYGGQEGVFTTTIQPNDQIRPERTQEIEYGVDLAFFNDRLSVGITQYEQHTTDAILDVSTAPTTGYFAKYDNAGEFKSWGTEVTADLLLLNNKALSWSIGANWAKNETCVLDLAGAETYGLAGFTGAVVSVVAPDDPERPEATCHPFGVFYGDDFIRFGRGSEVDGVAIDDAYSGWSEGDLYINEDGFPESDPQSRVIGDPNPDWIAGLRSTITLGQNLRISGLLDIKQGGDMWNGTKGALYFFGTHKDTEPYHGDGKTETFCDTYYTQWNCAGPGAGQEVNLTWWNWFAGGIGSSFTGPSVQSIEDGGFVKLRNVSVAYTVRGDWMQRLGFSSAELAVTGRNLMTWTEYTGIDPESNLWGQSLGRGVDYFGNPQTRSFIFNVTLNR